MLNLLIFLLSLFIYFFIFLSFSFLQFLVSCVLWLLLSFICHLPLVLLRSLALAETSYLSIVLSFGFQCWHFSRWTGEILFTEGVHFCLCFAFYWDHLILLYFLDLFTDVYAVLFPISELQKICCMNAVIDVALFSA